jgi:hypothetical protein
MPAQECGEVTLNENSWVGSSANVYVVKHVLETELDCKVKVTKIAEIPAFQAWPTARPTRSSRTGSTPTSTRSTSRSRARSRMPGRSA